MKVFINPGHDVDFDSGACGFGLRECDVALEIGLLVQKYLEAAGCEVKLLQSDNLLEDTDYPQERPVAVVEEANAWPADVFVSIHCNAAADDSAHGTEVLAYSNENTSEGARLAGFIQSQIVDALGTTDRGVKARPGLIVLKHTDMPAALVEMAFISNEADNALLRDNQDDFARAIARGVTDYECELTN